DLAALLEPLQDLPPSRGDRGSQLVDSPEVREEEPQQCLELDLRGSGRLAFEPRRDLRAAARGDLVFGARAPRALILDGRREAAGHEAFDLVVDVGLGPRPGPAQRTAHLAGELVGGPRTAGEQAR